MVTKFQNRLKELRTEKGLSQKELAQKIGATYSAVSFWETGVNEPKISYVISLCKFFDVSADYLLGLVD
ncbi:MAG: helix-turn-helix transcriptional regulator [Clostridia bacterium]|nr:helix-turn-helix transcriptional regulator [Clostridia bacterium]